MYMAFRGCIEGGEPFSEGCADCFGGMWEVAAGRQARMRMSRTRQSLPPLYDRESSSGLATSSAGDLAWIRGGTPRSYP